MVEFTEDYFGRLHVHTDGTVRYPVPGYENIYVTHFGEVFIGEVYQYPIRAGNAFVVWTSDEDDSLVLISKLVVAAFYQGDKQRVKVTHIDDNGRNNRLDNLLLLYQDVSGFWKVVPYRERDGFRQIDFRISKPFISGAQVQCIETEEIFPTVLAAAAHAGRSRATMYNHIAGRTKRCGQYTYRRL